MPSDIQDRDGGALLMASLFGGFPFLIKLYADGGYQGPVVPERGETNSGAQVNVEIVKRSDRHARGSVAPCPSGGWSNAPSLGSAADRLAKDWECLNHKALAFLRLASIRLMLRKLCNPA